MWHFQCQTCECLNGEVDCWPMECPPVDCQNAFLPKDDCCYRCPEENKCTHRHRNGTSTECHLLQNIIESGTRVTLPHKNCLSCQCRVSRNYLILEMLHKYIAYNCFPSPNLTPRSNKSDLSHPQHITHLILKPFCK